MNTPEEPREQPMDETAPKESVPKENAPKESADAEPSQADAEPSQDGAQSAAIYTRRRGAPTLTFWVLLCLIVPAVGTLVIAPLAGVSGLTALLIVTLAAVLAIGFPLAGLIALVDAIIQRQRQRQHRR